MLSLALGNNLVAGSALDVGGAVAIVGSGVVLTGSESVSTTGVSAGTGGIAVGTGVLVACLTGSNDHVTVLTLDAGGAVAVVSSSFVSSASGSGVEVLGAAGVGAGSILGAVGNLTGVSSAGLELYLEVSRSSKSGNRIALFLQVHVVLANIAGQIGSGDICALQLDSVHGSVSYGSGSLDFQSAALDNDVLGNNTAVGISSLTLGVSNLNNHIALTLNLQGSKLGIQSAGGFLSTQKNTDDIVGVDIHIGVTDNGVSYSLGVNVGNEHNSRLAIVINALLAGYVPATIFDQNVCTYKLNCAVLTGIGSGDVHSTADKADAGAGFVVVVAEIEVNNEGIAAVTGQVQNVVFTADELNVGLLLRGISVNQGAAVGSGGTSNVVGALVDNVQSASISTGQRKEALIVVEVCVLQGQGSLAVNDGEGNIPAGCGVGDCYGQLGGVFLGLPVQGRGNICCCIVIIDGNRDTPEADGLRYCSCLDGQNSNCRQQADDHNKSQCQA